MSHLELKHVPTEVLWTICSHLEYPNRLSLHSLSMASKQMRSALLPILFRKVKITMRGEEDLKRSLAALPWELTKHLHQLVIQGWIPENEEELEDITATYNDIPRQVLDGVEYRFVQPNLPLWKALGERICSQTRPVTASENDAWKPLADFITNIPVLTDIFFNSACQLPPCLLQSLHSRVTSCKLHMNTFRLRTVEPGPNPVLHSQEMDIIRSPCLYSVTTNFTEYLGRRDTCSYFTPVLADIAGKYAPNLKELYIFHQPFHDPRRPQNLAPFHRPPWQGFRANQTHESDSPLLRVNRSLRSLAIPGAGAGTLLKAINTSALRTMYCTSALIDEELPFLVNECRLDSLQTLQLTLNLRLPKRYPRQPATEQYDAKVSSFLLRLPALTELMCDGNITQSRFNLILNAVGSQLKVLCIQQTIINVDLEPLLGTSDELRSKIAESCPNLSYTSVKLLNEGMPTEFVVESFVKRYVWQ